MFVGFNKDKINVDDICDDEQFYTTVMQPGSKYFFVVVVLDILFKKSETHYTLIADTVPHLLEIISATYHSVTKVYLVTPTHMNHSDDLIMGRLSKISVGYEPENIEQEAYIFEVLRKTEYVDSTLGTPVPYLCNITRICSFKMAWDK